MWHWQSILQQIPSAGSWISYTRKDKGVGLAAFVAQMRNSHDNDGDWQFLCGGKHSPADARIVSLSEIITLDKSVVELSDLECGAYAEIKDNQWIVYKRNS